MISVNFDTPECVNAQVRWYRELGYPENKGLWKGAFLLRRHNDPGLIEVMETGSIMCSYIRIGTNCRYRWQHGYMASSRG